jgi:hypothetical protein
MAKKPNIHVGDRVAYSANWLRSVGLVTGPYPFLRGRVAAIDEITKGFSLAVVEWEGEADAPARINIANLAKVGTAAMNAN